MFYYGIGPNTSGDNHAIVDAFNIAFRQRVLRKVVKNFFIGPEIDCQCLSGVKFQQPEHGGFELPTGSQKFKVRSVCFYRYINPAFSINQ
jgi:hypothetical protein